MNKGRRYDDRKLNLKKVFGAIIILILFIALIYFFISSMIAQKQNGVISATKYFTLYKDGLYGVIDESGNEIIKPFYKEFVSIPNPNKDVFIATYDVNYETGEYKTKVLNKKNKEILTQYEIVEPIQYLENNVVRFDEDLIKIKKENLYGLVTLSGEGICNPIYESIEVLDTNYFKVTKDGKTGVVNSDGTEILPLKYQDVEILPNTLALFKVEIDNNFGIVDKQDNIVLPAQYSDVLKETTDNNYVVNNSGNLQVLNKEKNIIIDNIKKVKEIDRNIIYQAQDDKYGVKNLEGQDVIEPKYEDIKQGFQESFIVKLNNLYGIIDNKLENKVDATYHNIKYNKDLNIYIADIDDILSDILNSDFEKKASGILLDISDNKIYLKENDENKIYNANFEILDEKTNSSNTLFIDKKENKYGLLDKKGNLVVDYIYDDIQPQNQYGYVAVKQGNMWGAIDSTGKKIVENIYNLDKYLEIDFIGKYHQGIDNGLVYYTDEHRG